jgi:hypothetical protein
MLLLPVFRYRFFVTDFSLQIRQTFARASNDAQLQQRLSQSQVLRMQIGEVDDMRHGCLVERYRKWGKPNCPAAVPVLRMGCRLCPVLPTNNDERICSSCFLSASIPA